MSWQITNAKEERKLFIVDWLKREFTMKALCARYGVSRKTGYKWLERFKQEGEKGLEERSHARHSYANETPKEIKKRLIELKLRFPTWGPQKLLDWLEEEERDRAWPASSTIGEILKRHGLVKPRRYKRRVVSQNEPFSECDSNNAVWSADFKGQFKVGGSYCYPLTIMDNFSRYLLSCEGLKHPNMEETRRCIERVFKEYGLPASIRTDNGQPFASIGLGGLTALNIWWIKLGIRHERIQPGCPQQNGRHERMHRTLKEATAKPAEGNFEDQQRSFDAFRKEYNEERPHQALAKKRPAEIYTGSLRPYPEQIEEVHYPNHYLIRQVKTNGEIKWFGKRYYVSELLHKEPIGLEPIDEERAIVYFGHHKLGLIDARSDKIIRP